MKLRRLSVEGLHGLIDLVIEFLPDLTIIVGRNGSGKTSALTLTADLLRLDIEALRATRFRNAELFLQDRVLGDVKVSVTTEARGRQLAVTLGDNPPARIALDIPTSVAFDKPSKESVRWWSQPSTEVVPWRSTGTLSNLTISDVFFPVLVDDSWVTTAKTLSDTTRLTFVRLDRTILAIDSEGSEAVDPGTTARRQRIGRGASSARDPIEDVIRVTHRKYLEFRSRVDRIKDSAHKDLLALHFSSIGAQLEQRAPGEKQLREQLIELRKRVEGSQLVADTPEIRSATDQFFADFKVLVDQAYAPQGRRAGRRTLKEESVELMVTFRQQQIEELLRIFDTEQRNMADAFSSIRAYLTTANRFLKESGKALSFSPSYELGFVVPKARGDTQILPPSIRSLKELSSGERQVIIVLTYLAFLAGEDSIFIVDEPELSLHLTWQTYLIEALQGLRPPECQIVLATHAPEIAGRAKQYVRVLRPDYLPHQDQST
jgi:predicted ATPase